MLWHDPLVRLLAALARRAGVPVVREARSLFADVLDHDMLSRPHCGIIPDLVCELRRTTPGVAGGRARLVRCLFDVKTVYAGNVQYGAAGRAGERAGAVERRARLVPAAYDLAARHQDRQMLVRRAVAAGGDADAVPALDDLPVGPCLRRLREFPPVTGLVFGSYGEASPGVHTLLAVLARAVAEREWREMGARTESEARGIVMAQMRRQLSLAAHAGHMRVLQARCAYVGLAHGAAVAEAARQGAPADAHAAMWPGPEPLGIDGRGSGG